MTNVGGNTAKESQFGMQVLPAAAAVLLAFAIYRTGSVGLAPAPGDLGAIPADRLQSLAERAEGSGPVDVLTWIVFALLGIFCHIVNRERAASVWRQAWPLVLLLLFISLSVLWSDVPDIALRRVIKHLLMVVIVAGIVMGAGSPREILRVAVVFTGLVMVMDIAYVVLIPAVGLDGNGAFQGVHGHKNNAGVFTMITIFVWLAAARWTEGIWLRIFLFLGTLLWVAFLIATQSRTSIGSTFLAIMLIIPLRYCVRNPGPGILVGFISLFFVSIGLFALILNGVTYQNIIETFEDDPSILTGRLNVWAFVYRIFLDHMWLGTGYGSLWSTGQAPAEKYADTMLTDFLLRLTHAHNGYLDILTTLGIIGAIILLIFLVSVFVVLIKAMRSPVMDSGRAMLVEISGFMLVATILGNATKTTYLTLTIVWPALILCYLLLIFVRLNDRSDEGRTRAPARRPGRVAAEPQPSLSRARPAPRRRHTEKV